MGHWGLGCGEGFSTPGERGIWGCDSKSWNIYLETKLRFRARISTLMHLFLIHKFIKHVAAAFELRFTKSVLV